MNLDFSIHQIPSPNSIESTTPVTLDQLPNELLQSILSYFPLHLLIHFRLVCTRWQNMIESMQQPNRCLILTDSDIPEEQIKSRFFDQLNLNELVCLKLKPNGRDAELRECFGALLRRLFPLIEQLLININFGPNLRFLLSLWPVQQITTLSVGGNMLNGDESDDMDLANRINSLTSLKRLDLVECYHGFYESLFHPTLGRIEHLSCSYADDCDYYEAGPLTGFIKHIGKNFSRLWIEKFDLDSEVILEWNSVNPVWMSSVTHLKLSIEDELEEIVRHLAEHAASLQVLHINSYRNVIFLTPQIIGNLGRLTHLKELNFSNVFITNFDEWKKMDVCDRNLAQLTSAILQLDMTNENENILKGALAFLFPNVQHLSIEY